MKVTQTESARDRYGEKVEAAWKKFQTVLLTAQKIVREGQSEYEQAVDLAWSQFVEEAGQGTGVFLPESQSREVSAFRRAALLRMDADKARREGRF